MMLYYIRQPDNKKEEYYLYQNTELTRVGEILHGIINNWRHAVEWMSALYDAHPNNYEVNNWFYQKYAE